MPDRRALVACPGFIGMVAGQATDWIRTEGMNDHAKGILLTTLGVLIISPDTLLIRLVDMDLWTLAVWRGLLQAIGLGAVLLCVYRRHTWAVFHAIGLVGVAIAIVFAGATFTFLAAVEGTTVANTLIILASSPMFAAVMSLIFLRERVAPRTWTAIAATAFGIALIVFGSHGPAQLFGDVMAILAAALLAAGWVIVRGRRQVNMIPALALSGLVFAGIAGLIVGTPTGPNEAQVFWLLLMGFAVVTPATALMTLGPRYISAPEVSLLLLLESVLGPLWVWLVIDEAPSLWSVIGGAVVLVTLVVHGLLGARAARRAAMA